MNIILTQNLYQILLRGDNMYSRAAGYEYFGKSRCLEDIYDKGYSNKVFHDIGYNDYELSEVEVDEDDIYNGRLSR